jgi:hypothetical protein
VTSRIFSFQALLLVAAAGCASPPAASVAPARAPRTAAADVAPATVAPATAEALAKEPLGELVCRTTDTVGVAYALFIEGTMARLRRVAPSGVTEVRILTVAHTDGMLIADVPGETDLVAHAATVRELHGNRLMRVGNWNEPWLGCEK